MGRRAIGFELVVSFNDTRINWRSSQQVATLAAFLHVPLRHGYAMSQKVIALYHAGGLLETTERCGTNHCSRLPSLP